MNRSVQIENGRKFADMHSKREFFAVANAWDAASAVMLAQVGFPAIATTSGGIAFSHGYPDGQHISRNEMLSVVKTIAEMVNLPVTADLEAGYGREPSDVAETVRLAIDAGAVGANIEDSTKGDPKDKGQPLFELDLAVERCRAARRAADITGVPFVLNARVDCFLLQGSGQEVIAETVRRGNAYAVAGASCVFVPGVVDRETITILAREISAPLNVLAAPGVPSVSELKAIRVTRLTFGTSLFRAAYSAAVGIARHVHDSGVYALDSDVITYKQLSHLLAGK